MAMRRQTKRTLALLGFLTAIAIVVYASGVLSPPPPRRLVIEDDEPVISSNNGKNSANGHGKKHGQHRKNHKVKNTIPSVEEDEEEEEVQKQEHILQKDEHGEHTRDRLVREAGENVFPGVDKDHLHGKIGYNKDGSPAIKLLPPLITETLEEKREHHKGTCFNLRRSDSIPLDRPLGDMRHPDCKRIVYGDNLPIASVVFVFYNEPATPLMRSVHSVLNRTPAHLLHEIVLIDDCSDTDWLKQPLEDYLKLMPKVKLVRLKARSGLMRARTAGAEASTGEVVVFLDSHIEVTEGWLEPMLGRVAEDPKHVVMPIIDSIHADTFEYAQGGIDILAHSWSLGQKGVGGRPPPHTKPMPSPIMAGGLFAISRAMFFEIGAYDPEMQIYGGEEVEISFRIWQCGLTLECMPCSRVGHVFRTGDFWKGQVYKVPYEVILRNKARAAAVWMDEYKDIAINLMHLPQNFDLGPLDYMLDIKKRLQCKPFKWYLENIYPELFVPNDDRHVFVKGHVRNPRLNVCIDTVGAHDQGAQIQAHGCNKQGRTQMFIYTKQNEIRVNAGDFDMCLDRANSANVHIWGCHSGKGNQFFKWDKTSGHIVDEGGNNCVQVRKSGDRYELSTAVCSDKQEMTWSIGPME